MNDFKPSVNISPQKLFDVIQQEYLICLLRVKIYPLAKHKTYWANLAKMKKEKILDLKRKYNLISIFDDEKIRAHYKEKIYNKQGLPNFYYPSEKIEQQQRYWDTKNYFALGCNVNFVDVNDSFKVKEGVIDSLFLEKRTILIQHEDKMLELNFDDVSRIIE